MSRSAAERARRLLTLLPMLAQDGEVPLAEAAVALDARPEDLADDLVTLSLCGVPPYTPYELVSVFLDGDTVVMHADLPGLSVPVRLSAEEARAFVTALETVGRDRSDPLVATLLEGAGPTEDDEALAARVVGRAAGVLGIVASAVDESRTLELRYLTGATGVITDRTVRPWALSEQGGLWYLSAFCETADAHRIFRVDRISEARPGDETFEPPADPPVYAPTVFATDAMPTATVVFDAGTPVEARDWPGASFQDGEKGEIIAEIPVGDPSWIVRQVVARMGSARLVSPPELQELVVRVANTLSEDLGS